MSETLFPAGPVDLEALDQFLMSDASPEDCMQLSDLDGFLTGIAIGPELVMPSEWLPAIWGGDEPACPSSDDSRQLSGLGNGGSGSRMEAMRPGRDAASGDWRWS